MKKWLVKKTGNIDQLELVDVALGPVPRDHLRIKVQKIGLNFADIFAILGVYSATPQTPFTPGLEYAGLVEAIGPDCSTDLKVGDEVMGVTRFGGHSEYIDTLPPYCRPLPSGWSLSQGASYIAQGLTAWYALKTLGHVQPGENVLIHSAAGGVGLAAMRFCRHLGAHPIGSVGRPRKIEFLKKYGFEDVFARGDDFKKNLIKHLNGRPLNMVLDAIGGKVQQESFETLAPMGKLIVFGAAEFAPSGNRLNPFKALYHYLMRPKYDVLNMISDNRSVMAFNIIWLWERHDLMDQLLREMGEANIDPPVIDREFSFEEMKDALIYFKSGRNTGKVVVSID